MTPEGQVKEAIKKLLDAYEPIWYYMPVQTGYGKHGVPDFICCVNGKFFAIEAKAGWDTEPKATTLQLTQIGLIHEAKGTTLIVNNRYVETLEAYLVMMGATKI